MQAVILAGGLGTRLKPITEKAPKPMVPINNKPFIGYQLEYLKRDGVEDALLLVAHLHGQIEDYVGDGSKFGINVEYSVEKEPMGTGGAIKLAEGKIQDNFLLLQGDNYLPLDYTKIFKIFVSSGKNGLVVTYHNNDGISNGNNTLVGADGLVKKYDKTREDQSLNVIDAGAYAFSKKVVELLPEGKSSFELEMFPKLIETGQFVAYPAEMRYYSLTKPENIGALENYLKSRDGGNKKVVFLDRDGTINKNAAYGDYIKKWEEFEFIPQSIVAMKILKDAGFSIIIITNQPGVGRKFMSAQDLAKIHYNMRKELAEGGAEVDAVYVCPHARDDNCDCRKPKPTLIFKAAEDFKIDLRTAHYIGDGDRDEETAKAAGCKYRGMPTDDGAALLKIAKGLASEVIK